MKMSHQNQINNKIEIDNNYYQDQYQDLLKQDLLNHILESGTKKQKKEIQNSNQLKICQRLTFERYVFMRKVYLALYIALLISAAACVISLLLFTNLIQNH